jgi:tRNA(Ile)-lysidine synthase
MEMTARRLRHRFLAETALQQKCRFIAFAHHADDQAELILIRLFRGGGSDGLGGMSALSPSPEDSRIALFRPFLGLRRTEIRVWLDQEGLKFREDASNTDLSIIRNRIRAGLIPQLETEYSPGLTKTLCRTAEILNADGDFIRQESLRWLGAADRPDFATLHIALQRAVLREQLWRLGHNPDFDLIERLRTNASMLQSAGGENLFARDLAGTVTPSRRPPIRRSSSSNGKAAEEKPGQVDFSIHAARGSVQLDGTTIHWSRRMRPLPFGKPGVEQFDLELLGAELRLRHWRPGDRYRPLGFPRDAKLQDIFVSRKIPRDARSKLVFLEQRPEGEIAWVQGLPPAETVKVTPTTSSLLVLRWNPD